jgi:hypothetical protein
MCRNNFRTIRRGRQFLLLTGSKNLVKDDIRKSLTMKLTSNKVNTILLTVIMWEWYLYNGVCKWIESLIEWWKLLIKKFIMICYNIYLQWLDFILNYNMKIKCKSNKFNEFNRYGSDEKIQLTIGNSYDVVQF